MNIFEKYKELLYPNPPLFEGPKLTLKDFEEMEENLKLQFPPEFKEFYSVFNGTYLLTKKYVRAKIQYSMYPYMTENCFSVDSLMILDKKRISEDSNSGGVKTIILGFYPGDPEYSGADDDDPETDGWDPIKKRQYLTFASAKGNKGYVMIGIDQTNFGKIFLWSKNDNEIGNPHFVAGSLFELLDNTSEDLH